MDKPKFLYIVQSSSGRTLHVWAASSNQAKREFCREYGISPSDYWCGVSALTARRLSPEEVNGGAVQAVASRDALRVLQGMLEIGAKAYAERRCVV